MQTHKHHIVPRHMGGTDDPSNLIELTIEEHALAHKALYEQFGKIEDKMAWLALSGKTQESERLRKVLAAREYRKFLNDDVKYAEWKRKISNTLAGRSLSDEHKRNISEGLLKAYREERKKYVRPSDEMLLANFERNKDKMADGRRNSKKWLDSVTSEEMRKRKSDMFKGRDITWGDKISSSKKGRSTKSTKSITVNSIQYPSISEAARQLNIPRHKLDKLSRIQGEFITL